MVGPHRTEVTRCGEGDEQAATFARGKEQVKEMSDGSAAERCPPNFQGP
jgi:hypothetical protein